MHVLTCNIVSDLSVPPCTTEHDTVNASYASVGGATRHTVVVLCVCVCVCHSVRCRHSASHAKN